MKTGGSEKGRKDKTMSTAEKNESRFGEVLKFLVSGGICWVVQTVFLVLLRDRLGLDTLIALPIAFLLATVANYLLAVFWIWPSAKGSDNTVKLGFLITSLIGLLLNELLMWIFRLVFGEDQVLFTVFGFEVRQYLINMCIVTALVMIWNYFTKRAILQSGLIRKLTRKK